ncbi:MAG: ACT domain-containing protein [Candidatus Omnitrophica bacterium]|nr:ACT domain-containing protein [Candidatus Omnitrophota bacterium]
MIKSVSIGEELVITTGNKVGLLADIAQMLANQGINIESALGYESGNTAKLMIVTNANLAILGELKKKKYKSVKETEVVVVELENKPGALKVVTTELGKAGIDIKYLYVTSPSPSVSGSHMVIQTSDNEKAMALLSKYVNSKA